MNYQEYMQMKQDGFNALPIFWAFDKKQFKEGMERFGLTEKDTDKIYALGSGGYYRKSDADIVRAWFKQEDELPELMKDHDFAVDAFIYELGNHEYHINHYQGDWEVLGCFYNVEWLGDGASTADYLNSLDIPECVKAYYVEAVSKFLKMAEENGWY